MKKLFFIIIFLLMFVFWLWSKDGVKIETKIVNKNSQINIYLDGFLLGSAKDTEPENKKLQIDFSNQDLNSRYFNNESKTDKNNILLNKDNYELNFILTNPFAVRLNFQGNKPYIFYFNPYRHLNSGWEDNYKVLENKINYQVQISLLNGIKWIFWIILKPFPFLMPIFMILFIFFNKINIYKQKINLKLSKKYILILLIIVALSFIWSRYLMTNYLDDSPHVPDSISYIILAKIISSGKFILSYSDIPNFIPKDQIKDYFYHWFQINKNGLFIPYLTGHPLVLAIGNVFGLLKYIPPMLGSLTLIMVFSISFYITNSFFFSIISMLLCFLSPFYQTQTIDYMSHNSAAFFILLSILPIFIDKKNIKYFFLTGFFLGMLLNTRPLTFIAVFISIMLYKIIESIISKKNHQFFLKLFYSILGSIFPLIIFFYYNFVTTGNIITTPYQFHGILNKIVFGSDFKIAYGMLNTFSNLTVFSLFFLKNYYISFFPLLMSLLILPFSGKYFNKIIFLQLLFFLIIGVWTLYDGNFFMYGPRFIYEVVPILTILYGVTFYILFNTLKQIKLKFFSYFIIILYLINILFFELSWLGKKQPEYSGITFVPANIYELKKFNFSDGRFLDIYNKNKNQNKVFLMKKCENWWCYSGVWLNQFPIRKSKPLFLTLPDNYQNEIKNAKVIDWNNLL